MDRSPVQHGSVQKSRGATIKACARCHRRKQRCVGFPACVNCSAANVPCSRDSTPLMRRLATLSKEELIKKIEALHQQVPSLDVDANSQSNSHNVMPGQSSPGRTPSASTASMNDFNVVEDLQFQPAVVDSAQNTAWDSFEIPDYSLSAVVSSRPTDPTPTSCVADVEDETIQDPRTQRELLTTFLESLHRRLPFCDYIGLLQAVDDIPTKPLGASIEQFRLYMACAIGARVRQLAGASQPWHPERYFARATHIETLLENTDPIEAVERHLWHVMYRLRSSFTSDVWYTIGLAMRTSIEVGLHRKHHYRTLNPRIRDRHRRLFWAVYIIERCVAWQLKRPFSISDCDIDAELPHPGTSPVILERDNSEQEAHINLRRPIDLRVYVSIINLSRLKSQVYSRLHGANSPPHSEEPILRLIHQARQIETSLKDYHDLDREFLQLHVKDAIMKLTEPFLSLIPQRQDLTVACLEAAGGVCRLFKRQRLERYLGYSFTMINSVFTAGLTICYILFKNPYMWTPARANELRVCSSALFAAAACNSSLNKYCDVLETVIEAVSQHVEQDEIILVVSEPNDSSSSNPTAQTIFHGLSHLLEEKEFEFPSHSYPKYYDETSVSTQSSWVSSSSVASSDVFSNDPLDFSVWDTMSLSNQDDNRVSELLPFNAEIRFD